MNIIIPLAGKDSRFKTFKPFIDIGGKPLIKHVLDQHTITPNDQLIFILLKEHEQKYDVSTELKKLFGEKIIIRILEKETWGAPCSILEGARDIIDTTTDILIELADVVRKLDNLYVDIKNKSADVAGIIPVQSDTVMTDRPWGYVYKYNNEVTELREKQDETTSPLATMGLYYFSHGNDFISATEQMIQKKSFQYKNNFFVGPVYNELIAMKKRVMISSVTIRHILGSPEDIKRIKDT